MLPFIILGIVTGSVYGLAGVGLVLTYKTSGIFNLAQGALATVAAYAFYYLNVERGVAWPVAALISVLILGAAMGISVGGTPWYALIGAAGTGLVPTYITSSDTSSYLEIIFGVAAVIGAVGLQARTPPALSRLLDRLGGRGRRAARRRDAVPAQPELGQAVPTALEVKGLTVRFGGLVAVDGLDLVAPSGQVTGLIGPNGAGKMTVFNACSGLVSPSAAKISLSGRDVTRYSAAQRARLGLGRTFQQMELSGSSSVLDNVLVGFEASRAGGNAYSQVISKRGDRRAGLARARSAIGLCGLAGLENAQAGSLSTGQRRLVELARCLAGPFSVLLLDEPSSGLDLGETQAFGRILRRVAGEEELTRAYLGHSDDIPI